MKNKKCVPCEVGGVPLKAEKIQKLLSRLSNSWSVENNLKLKREFKYKDFIEAMKFVNQGEDAELTRLAAEKYTQFKLQQIDPV